MKQPLLNFNDVINNEGKSEPSLTGYIFFLQPQKPAFKAFVYVENGKITHPKKGFRKKDRFIVDVEFLDDHHPSATDFLNKCHHIEKEIKEILKYATSI